MFGQATVTSITGPDFNLVSIPRFAFGCVCVLLFLTFLGFEDNISLWLRCEVKTLQKLQKKIKTIKESRTSMFSDFMQISWISMSNGHNRKQFELRVFFLLVFFSLQLISIFFLHFYLPRFSVSFLCSTHIWLFYCFAFFCWCVSLGLSSFKFIFLWLVCFAVVSFGFCG